ncbi:MAG: cell wall hydrolase [Pseudomonadota bacterium]
MVPVVLSVSLLHGSHLLPNSGQAADLDWYTIGGAVGSGRGTQAQVETIDTPGAPVPEERHLAVAARAFSLSQSTSEPVSKLLAIDCMTAAVHYEAAGEPLQGQRAVAQVVINRMKHAAFPGSVCGVVFEGSTRDTGCQFTFTCDGSLSRRPSMRGWLHARSVAAAALSGLVETSVGHATHYHANTVFPAWARALTKVRTIGSHSFYIWPNGAANPANFNARYRGAEDMPLEARKPLVGLLLAEAEQPIATSILPENVQAAQTPEAIADGGDLYDTDAGMSERAQGVDTGNGIVQGSQRLVVPQAKLLVDEEQSELIEPGHVIKD